MLNILIFTSLILTPTSEAAGQQLVITKDVTVPSNQHYETVVVVSGKVDFFGSTSKLYLINGEVTLQKDSSVDDQIWIVSGQIFQKDGAKVPTSGIQKVGANSMPSTFDFSWMKNFNFEKEGSWFDWLAAPFVFLFKLLAFFAIIIIGALVLSLAPRISRSADQSLQEYPWKSFFTGLSAIFLFLPIIGILTISIVGILFIPVVAFFYLLFLAAGTFSVARALGSALIPQKHTRWATLIGLGSLLVLISIPLVGGPVCSVLLIAGLGAFFRSVFDSRSNQDGGNVINAQSYSI